MANFRKETDEIYIVTPCQLIDNETYSNLSFEERIGLLVDYTNPLNSDR